MRRFNEIERPLCVQMDARRSSEHARSSARPSAKSSTRSPPDECTNYFAKFGKRANLNSSRSNTNFRFAEMVNSHADCWQPTSNTSRECAWCLDGTFRADFIDDRTGQSTSGRGSACSRRAGLPLENSIKSSLVLRTRAFQVAGCRVTCRASGLWHCGRSCGKKPIPISCADDSVGSAQPSLDVRKLVYINKTWTRSTGTVARLPRAVRLFGRTRTRNLEFTHRAFRKSIQIFGPIPSGQKAPALGVLPPSRMTRHIGARVRLTAKTTTLGALP